MRSACRIAESAIRRAGLMNRAPILQDLATTLPYRYLGLKKSTFITEVMGLRQVFADTLKPEGERTQWELFGQRYSWIAEATQEEINQVSKDIFRAPSDIAERWKDIPDSEYENFISGEARWSKEEFCEHIARQIVRGPTLRAKDRKTISWRDYTALEVELSNEDPHDVLRRLGNGTRFSMRGLLRIFITAIFLTGMRPIEVWTCSLLIPDTRRRFTDDMRDMVRKNPSGALLNGYLVPLEELLVGASLTPRRTVLDAVARAGAPAVMMIRSAKQTNANQDARSPVRLLILEDVPEASLGLLCAASLLKMAGVPVEQADNYRTNLIRRLKGLTLAIPDLKSRNVNLYSFRHSFATRARRVYSPAEAAAMTGHTGKDSLYAYGQRNVKKGGTLQKTHHWLPSPAPEIVAVIEHAWYPNEVAPTPLPRLEQS